MTDLQTMYLNARAQGRRHRAALEEVGQRTGLDPDTVGRCIQRARRADERDERAKGVTS